MRALLMVALLAALLMVPGGVGFALSAPAHGSRPTPPAGVDTDPILPAWIINTDGHTNPHWPTTPVNVQSVTQTTINGVPYAQVRTNSIADYYTTMTSDLVQELNSR